MTRSYGYGHRWRSLMASYDWGHWRVKDDDESAYAAEYVVRELRFRAGYTRLMDGSHWMYTTARGWVATELTKL